MSDKDDLKNFPLPLDTDIEEEVPVKKNAFDPKTGRITSNYQLEKVTTRYIHAPKEKLRCKPTTHIFQISDPNRWLFTCSNCPYAFKASPIAYIFKEGKLISKRTNIPV